MAKPTKNRRTNQLTKAQKVAEVQALKEQGFTYKQVQEITGLALQTISDYLKVKDETTEAIKNVIKRHNIEYDFKLANRAKDRILEKLDDEAVMKKTKLYEITGLYKVARELQEPRAGQGVGTAIQVNVNIDTKKGSYSIEG